MRDILERLQGPRTPQGGSWPYPNLHDEAAEEITRLREENAGLREVLKPFARMEDRCLGRHDVDYEYVLISHIRAAAAAIREGGKDEKV